MTGQVDKQVKQQNRAWLVLSKIVLHIVVAQWQSKGQRTQVVDAILQLSFVTQSVRNLFCVLWKKKKKKKNKKKKKKKIQYKLILKKKQIYVEHFLLKYQIIKQISHIHINIYIEIFLKYIQIYIIYYDNKYILLSFYYFQYQYLSTARYVQQKIVIKVIIYQFSSDKRNFYLKSFFWNKQIRGVFVSIILIAIVKSFSFFNFIVQNKNQKININLQKNQLIIMLTCTYDESIICNNQQQLFLLFQYNLQNLYYLVQLYLQQQQLQNNIILRLQFHIYFNFNEFELYLFIYLQKQYFLIYYVLQYYCYLYNVFIIIFIIYLDLTLRKLLKMSTLQQFLAFFCKEIIILQFQKQLILKPRQYSCIMKNYNSLLIINFLNRNQKL
eukprot:TRINITY_DN3756_c0_g1_i1.p1 TRINITY_DN3756_c0_g1~~TRINITY_DN3756_c0_g1_i1.p1  ORF type:complete len:383 (+),score=-15.82 TRINITY_DN3756_c0_g1_i1:783-1931(+)